MPSELMWKVLEFYSTGYNHLSKFPVSYDPKSRMYKYDGSFKSHFWYYFIHIFVISGSGFVCCAWPIVSSYMGINKTVTGSQCIIFGIWFLVAGFVEGIVAEFINEGPLMTSLVNKFNRYYTQLCEEYKDKPKENSARTSASKAKKLYINPKNLSLEDFQGLTEKLKDKDFIIAICMWMIVLETMFLPVPFAIMGLYTDFVPYKFILEDLLPTEIYNQWTTQGLILIGSFVVLSIGLAEGFRIFPLLAIYFAFPVHQYLEAYQIIENELAKIRDGKVTSDGHMDRLYCQYQAMKVTSHEAYTFNPREIAALFWSSQFIIAWLIFGTIRFGNILPLANFLMFPFAAVAALSLTVIILAFGTGIHTQSSDLLESWKGTIDMKSKYHRKKLRSMQPVLMYAGFQGCVFFVLDKDLKIDYFTEVVNMTINRLMSIPDATIQKLKFRGVIKSVI